MLLRSDVGVAFTTQKVCVYRSMCAYQADNGIVDLFFVCFFVVVFFLFFFVCLFFLCVCFFWGGEGCKICYSSILQS